MKVTLPPDSLLRRRAVAAATTVAERGYHKTRITPGEAYEPALAHAVSHAISELYNANRHVEWEQGLADVLALALLVPFGDVCAHCWVTHDDATCYPHAFDTDTGQAHYQCHRCTRTWECWWAEDGYAWG